MKLVEFPEQTVIVAEHQEEYENLPAWKKPDDPQGETICCWQLSFRERLKLLLTGRLWHSILTFNQPLQPVRMQVEYPFVRPE